VIDQIHLFWLDYCS